MPVFADPAATTVRHFSHADGRWRIEAVRAMAGFPAAVAVSRDAGAVLAEWNHQILWLSAFALFAAIAIGVMVYLIARQFKTHADLAAMRADRIEAEKIESERARLAAETELLKSERLSVLGQLTATVAHELRNPLSAIRNTLFTVKEMATNAGVKLDRPIARMERSIERCDRIISDLLEYTRNRELNRTDLRFDRWLADLLARTERCRRRSRCRPSCAPRARSCRPMPTGCAASSSTSSRTPRRRWRKPRPIATKRLTVRTALAEARWC